VLRRMKEARREKVAIYAFRLILIVGHCKRGLLLCGTCFWAGPRLPAKYVVFGYRDRQVHHCDPLRSCRSIPAKDNKIDALCEAAQNVLEQI
jgi:hypothetical protein